MPTRRDTPTAFCGARTRSTGPKGARYPTCHRPAGWGTEHPGLGRCKLHGGRAHTTHGRYSTVRHERLSERIEEYAADPDPLNMMRDLALMRALLHDYIERAEAMRDALLAWYHSFSDEYQEELSTARELWIGNGGAPEAFHPPTPIPTRPRQVLDLADAGKLLSEVTKIVERIEKIRAENAISLPELERLMHEMGRIVAHHVTTEATVTKIREGWLALRV